MHISNANGILQQGTTKDWPKREDLIPGYKNVVQATLADNQKILLPPFHIKLGILKQFVISFGQEWSMFPTSQH